MKTMILICIALLSCTGTKLLMAQPAAVRIQIGGPSGVKSEEQMLRIMQLHIDEMEEILSLNEAQVQKLSLAAKAATRRAYSEQQPRAGLRMGQQFGQQKIDPDSLSDEDQEAGNGSDSSGDSEVRKIMMPVKVSTVMTSQLWKKPPTILCCSIEWH